MKKYIISFLAFFSVSSTATADPASDKAMLWGSTKDVSIVMAQLVTNEMCEEFKKRLSVETSSIVYSCRPNTPFEKKVAILLVTDKPRFAGYFEDMSLCNLIISNWSDEYNRFACLPREY